MVVNGYDELYCVILMIPVVDMMNYIIMLSIYYAGYQDEWGYLWMDHSAGPDAGKNIISIQYVLQYSTSTVCSRVV